MVQTDKDKAVMITMTLPLLEMRQDTCISLPFSCPEAGK